MNEYMRPDYEVMEFAANEYVAACEWIPNKTELGLHCAGGGSTEVLVMGNSGSKMPGDLYNWNVTYKTANGASGSGNLLPIFQKTDYTDNNDNTFLESEFVFTGNYGFTGIISENHTQDDQDGEYTSWGSSANPNSEYYLGNMYNANGSGFQWWTDQSFHLVSTIINMTKNRS